MYFETEEESIMIVIVKILGDISEYLFFTSFFNFK